ncbi:MAG: hypothetical protein JWN48_5158 [Myxococcaceae bacterium]|nr:hypothetical protein [Myxococcaceae bacterium]
MANKSGAEAGALLRGTKLIKKAIEKGRAEAFAEPEPVASAVLKKLALPNGESVSPSMKELLKVDALWLGMEFDEDEGDIESVTFEEAVEDFFGEDAPALFGEACELFDGDCVLIGGAADELRVLYVGEPDESGEYAVLTVAKAPEPWVQLAPFDVWVAQELGALPAGSPKGAVPPGYEAAAKELADAVGDGRVGFSPTAGEARADDDEEDEEDDEDDEDAEDAEEASEADKNEGDV